MFYDNFYIIFFPPFANLNTSTSQVYYWRESSLIPDLLVSKEKKTKGFYSTMAEPSGHLTDLVPYSKYQMFMVVANNRFEGPRSNTVEFNTKEGGKDATLTSKHCTKML